MNFANMCDHRKGKFSNRNTKFGSLLGQVLLTEVGDLVKIVLSVLSVLRNRHVEVFDVLPWCDGCMIMSSRNGELFRLELAKESSNDVRLVFLKRLMHRFA